MNKYKVGDPVYVQAKPTEDKYPAVIELVLDDSYAVHWLESNQHVRVPAHAVVSLREVDEDE